MPLEVGSRVGPYEVTGPLGAGGMGEVWRARDTRLGRDVAIKGLPEAFARDAERRARFDREARLLASLNHPNIAAIYGLEEADGRPYLVLELVDGESLAQLLVRGPLSVRETLELGQQVAAAIEAAHDKGVIHRDLKPGNVMRTAGGLVKVLDFGLARGGALESGAPVGLSAPPTMALSATGVGVVLGTAPYMSPEQARGLPVDRRTDVWAFGCLLYECLAGRPAFAGETASDILARVLEREPAWDALPAALPARLRDLVRRCLTKEQAERPRDIGDLKRELGAILAELSAPRAAADRAPAAGAPSLAVLYFENLARDPESDYFCAGITEDILTDLSKIQGLRVASRNAVARYRGQNVDLAEVGRALGVRHVLEGSVRRAGDRLRITVQLVNAADGFHLWAERYDRTLEDVFAVQEEIASSIARALQVALSPSEVRALGERKPDDARAYDLYLKGRARYEVYSRASLAQALELFRQAIAVDPNYALAWTGVADTYGQLLQYAIAEDPDEAKRLGFEAAERALAIDPRLPEAYKARALLERFTGDHAAARRSLEHAVELNPRFTSALMNLAVDDYDKADIAACLRRNLRVLAIDPQERFALTWCAWLYEQLEATDEAWATLRRLRPLADTEFYLTACYGLQAGLQIASGDFAGAEATQQEGLAAGARPADMRASEALRLASVGRPDEARAILRELVELPGLNSGTICDSAAAAARVGDLALGTRFLTRPVVATLAASLVRLSRALHPYADVPPFAPRRRDAVLVWPLEAPRLDAARHAMFREVRIESAEPPRSSVLDGVSSPE